MLRGWVNYFAVGHSSECFDHTKDWVVCVLRRYRLPPPWLPRIDGNARDLNLGRRSASLGRLPGVTVLPVEIGVA
jgi:hypothetical protein